MSDTCYVRLGTEEDQMTTQTTTQVETPVDTADLGSLDFGMDKVYCHRVPYQQGARTNIELLALSQVKALCGFKFNPTKYYQGNMPPICPKCEQMWKFWDAG